MGIRSADRGLWAHRVCRLTTAVGNWSAHRGLWRHRVSRQRALGVSGLKTEDSGGIGSVDRSPMGASGLQTEVCGCIGLQTEVCGVCRRMSAEGMTSAVRGLWGHRDCRQRYVGVSGLHTEVYGVIGCGDRGLRGHGLQSEDCGGIGSADRGLRVHRVCRPTTAVSIRSAQRGL